MKMLTRGGLFVVVGIFALSVIPAFAFDCPNMYKAVMAYYEKSTKVAGVDKAKSSRSSSRTQRARPRPAFLWKLRTSP